MRIEPGAAADGAPRRAAAAAPLAMPDAPHLAALRRAWKAGRTPQPPALPGAIRLESGDLDPQVLSAYAVIPASGVATSPALVAWRARPTPRRTLPVLVHFPAPIGPAQHEALRRAGLTVRGYLPENTLLADGAPEDLPRAAAAWPGARVFAYLADWKLDPFLRALPGLAAAEGIAPAGARVEVSIRTLAPEDAPALARAIGGVTAVAAGPRWGLVRATRALAELPELAADGAVQWIEPYVAPRLLSDVAVRGDMMNATNVWSARGLTGAGQIVGHADTGLDTGSFATLSPDFAEKIRVAIARGRPGDWSDRDGHGTHTAGLIVGTGARAGGRFKGTAPGAQLVHQSLADSAGRLTGLPADLNELYRQAYTNGARIHSDSWGSALFGQYPVAAQQTDEFVWDYPDLLPVFAAGNEGMDADRDGRIDPDSLSAPGTAKNALTVGASESDRAPGSGAYTSYGWGALWPSDYPAPPIRDDLTARPADGAHQGLAAFSSRGPTDDGRMKPDVVAPGAHVVAARSRGLGAGTGWGVFPGNTNYVYNGGTSMATPLVAGAAALARQYLVESRGRTNPSAALVKAVLLNGARSLTPGQYGTNAATREIPAVRPNPAEGWGQVDVEGTLFPAPPAAWLERDEKDGLVTGATRDHVFEVAEGGGVSLTLVWSDYPALSGAGLKRVNDLDLEWWAPDGRRIAAGTNRLDNSEQLDAPAGAAGTYTARVRAVSAPMGPQPYALVARGAVRAAPTLDHTPLGNQWATNDSHEVTLGIGGPTAFDPGPVRCHWRAGAPPAGDFSTLVMTQRPDGMFVAHLPPQPAGVGVDYYLTAGVGAAAASHPAAAPSAWHHFELVAPLILTVAGQPAEWLSPTPGYGAHTVASGVVIAASAPAFTNLAPDTRIVCAGWTLDDGAGGAGTGTAVVFVARAHHTLVWRWASAYALTQTSAPAGVVDTQSWWAAFSAAQTVAAPETALPGGVAHRFTGWRLNGARQPAATGRAVNPATLPELWQPVAAEARYRPETQDADSDGLPDWWEEYYFGSTAVAPEADDDGDGFSNLREWRDGCVPDDAADAPRPPTLVFIPPAPIQPAPAPWPLAADIRDNHGVSNALLRWRRNDEGWTSAALAQDGVSNRWTGVLPAPGTNGDVFVYFLEAADHAGLAVTSGPHTIAAQYPQAVITPPGEGPHELPGAVSNVWLVISNAGLADLHWSLETHLFFDDVEGGTNDWAHAGTNDAWHIRGDRFASPQRAWHFGGGTNGTYPDRAHAALTGPPIRLDAPARLHFRHWARMEYDDDQMDNHYWDGGVVELSTNDGAAFFPLTPDGGYPHRVTDNPDSPFPPETPCFGDTGGRWEEAVCDLTSWTGATARVRFRFGSDAYVTEEGWYVDDVRITPTGGAPDWLRPAATGGVVAAGAADAVALTLDASTLAPDETRRAVLRLTNNSPVAPQSARMPLALRNSRPSPPFTTGETPLWWLAQYGLTNTPPQQEAESDPDGDGMLTWQEYRARTDPTNPASVALWLDAPALCVTGWWEQVYVDAESGLVQTQQMPRGSGVVIRWLSFTNQALQYDVWTAADPAAGFVPWLTGIPATPPINTLTNDQLAPALFFQIRARRP